MITDPDGIYRDGNGKPITAPTRAPSAVEEVENEARASETWPQKAKMVSRELALDLALRALDAGPQEQNNAVVAQPDGVGASTSKQGKERQRSKLEDAGENPADGTLTAAPG